MHVESFSLTSRFLMIPKEQEELMIKMMLLQNTGMLYQFLVGEVFLLNHQVAPTVWLLNLAFYTLPLSQTHLL